ncbi:MAG: YraN family protein [Fretibacterium sp.]|nr:YraN family protein [Fretibacterium sp.]
MAHTEAWELGRRAEDYAARRVASLGWKLLGRNIRSRYGELDIVAMDGPAEELVVVEVRCRTASEVQSPLDSVGPRKLHALVRAGQAFVEKTGWTGFWRIDLIGFTAAPNAPEETWQMEHIRDITTGLL